MKKAVQTGVRNALREDLLSEKKLRQPTNDVIDKFNDE